ncbi:hypothetical protein NPIL_526331 [Nephila pilipes]|uniref:Uncharacterized protein n=1 Tax=Nephila pilipes TaxID=299642 RepID=A0A8X6PW22_NEPPI|nr:hypothetical protein NPIL_526331 [Nephila pilipes]
MGFRKIRIPKKKWPLQASPASVKDGWKDFHRGVPREVSCGHVLFGGGLFIYNSSRGSSREPFSCKMHEGLDAYVTIREGTVGSSLAIDRRIDCSCLQQQYLQFGLDGPFTQKSKFDSNV